MGRILASLALLLMAGNAWGSPSAKLPAQKERIQQAVHRYDPSLTPEHYGHRLVSLSTKDECLFPVVFLGPGSGYCGSGGCTLLIFACDGKAYRLLADPSVALPPLYLSQSSHHGYRDLKVHVRTRGLVRLSFDGKSYPSNASLAPDAKKEPTNRLLWDEAQPFP